MPKSHVTKIAPTAFKAGNRCGVCNESSGEQLVRATLTDLQLPFESQYSLLSLNNRSYDFVIILADGKRVFIEWDGGQHFRYCHGFHKNEDAFFIGQLADILKTQEVMNHQEKMIRIDYTWLKKSVREIGKFIVEAIRSSQWLVLSNPHMYTWLTTQIVVPHDN